MLSRYIVREREERPISRSIKTNGNGHLNHIQGGAAVGYQRQPARVRDEEVVGNGGVGNIGNPAVERWWV